MRTMLVWNTVRIYIYIHRNTATKKERDKKSASSPDLHSKPDKSFVFNLGCVFILRNMQAQFKQLRTY